MTRRQQLTWWGTGGALLLFAITGLVGSLVKAAQPPAPWQVTVVSASAVADQPPLQRADPANRWLIVRAKVENTGKSSQTGLASILRLSGVDGLLAPEPKVVLLRDASRVDRLHPGLPEDLVFAWEQTAVSAPPQQITVQVNGAAPITMAVNAG